MLSEVPDLSLCRITGYLEATAKGSDRLFHLLTLPCHTALTFVLITYLIQSSVIRQYITATERCC